MSINKKIMIYGFTALLIVAIITVCLAAKDVKEDVEADYETEAPTSSINGRTILVDPGHGGFDAGASKDNVLEKDLNLNVALKLKDKIRERGGNVLMTRDTDVSTADENRKDGSTKKASDLKKRKEMIKDSDIAVSIHMNKFEQSKYWGAQVFYADRSEESKALGETIQESLKQYLSDGNQRVAKKSDGSIFLLKNADKPVVIVECGFLSNPDELERLKDDAYQNKIAEGICIGIEKYFDIYLP